MLKIAVFLVCIGAVFVAGESKSDISSLVTPSPSMTVKPSSQISSVKVNSTAKLSPSTMSKNTSHTSHSMSPTSAKPSPTTVKPMTSSASPNKTTPKPPTTTPKPTTPKPTTPPPYANFDVKGKNGSYCLLAQFEAVFTVQYVSIVNKTTNKTKQEITKVELNRTTAVGASMEGSMCGADKSTLVISWPKKTGLYGDNNKTSLYVITMEFAKLVNKSKAWEMRSFSFKATLKDNKAFHMPTVDSIISSSNDTSAISGKKAQYYTCKADTMDLKTKTKNATVHADLKDLKVEPFVEKKNHTFDNSANDCAADNPTNKPGDNDIVPIAVGCALAGLVLIVLIAYIIGRRKSHRGYEKV